MASRPAEAVDTDPKLNLRRRRYPRHALRSLAYVKLDQMNGGIIRDLTQSGVAIQAVTPLEPGEEVNLRFDLLSPRVRAETRGRVAWSDANGQGGVQFVDLAPRTQRALRDWIFNQMLSAAIISGRDAIFPSFEPEIMLSTSTRSAIVVDAELGDFEAPHIRWGWLSLSPRSFAIFVDTLVLLCAALLFSISSLVMMGGLPEWPLAIAVFLTASTIFVAVYQVMFSDLLCGATPGRRLAMLASGSSGEEEPAQRFR
jgi:hypothetical protein